MERWDREEGQLIQKLTAHKDEKMLGGNFSVFQKTAIWNRMTKELGFQQEEKERSLFFWYVRYFLSGFSQAFLHPGMALTSSIVFLLGGWAVAASAASSIPGDFLYHVTMGTEGVQLTLAGGNEQRTQLHAEFAARRLQEVNEISVSSRGDKEDLMREAVGNLTAELKSVRTDLENLPAVTPQAATQIAKIMEQKVAAQSSVLEQSEVVGASFSSEQMVEAQEAVKATELAVTEMVVQTHEASGGGSEDREKTEGYLKPMFQEDLKKISSSLNEAYGRLTTVRRVVAAGRVSEGEGEIYQKEMERIETSLGGFEEILRETMDVYAAGGYRRVLELVGIMKGNLAQAEADLQALEIELSTSVRLESSTKNEDQAGVEGK